MLLGSHDSMSRCRPRVLCECLSQFSHDPRPCTQQQVSPISRPQPQTTKFTPFFTKDQHLSERKSNFTAMFFHSKFSIKKHHHLYTNLYVASNACFNNADISFYCINTFKLSGSHACYRFTDMHHVTCNKRKKDVQKLMNKYLVS